MNKKYLFYGGILGPLFFLLNDIIGGIVTPNFNYIKITVSELTQAGSNYWFGSLLLSTAAVFGILFGIGIISRYKFKQNRLLYIAGIITIILGISNIFTGTIFPVDPMGEDLTFTGTMHLVLVGLSALLVFPYLVIMERGLNKEKKHSSLTLFTIIAALVMLIAGGLSGLFIAKDIELLGLVERVNVYTFQIWTIMITLTLLRRYRSHIKYNQTD